jgi:SAM-dependent methyltransferase
MEKPGDIALEAYEKMAESFAQLAPDKAENAYVEQPSMRKFLGEVRGLKVLDAGCGPGILADYLATQGADVTAFDVSPKMLEFAGVRVGGRVKLVLASMTEPLTFAASGEFDLVASSLAIDYVKDWSVPLGEFHRLLKPGGRIVLTVSHPVAAYQYYKPPFVTGVHYVETKWKTLDGEKVVMPDYYRSFDEMINPIIAAGFVLRRVADTLPAEALKAKDAAAYERYRHQPPFLCLEAQKP